MEPWKEMRKWRTKMTVKRRRRRSRKTYRKKRRRRSGKVMVAVFVKVV